MITIGGVTYRLPAAVFDGGAAYQGRHSSMLLQLPLLPPSAGPGSELVMVLMVEPSTPNAKQRAEHVLEGVRANAHTEVSLDPRRHDKPFTPISKPVADAPFGLVQVTTDASDSLGDDVFVRPPLNRVTEYVACVRLGGMHGYATTPQCSQGFAGPDVEMKITYSRKNLAKLDQIRQAVLAYLNSHKVS